MNRKVFSIFQFSPPSFLNARVTNRVKPPLPTTAMKCPNLIVFTALAMLLAGACNKKPTADAKQVADLELKARQAEERQKELQQQLDDQKLAAEREGIERERMQVEEARAELAQLQGESATAAADQLRQREEALTTREGQFVRLQTTLDDQQVAIDQSFQQLSERERDLAGREALDVRDDGGPQAPVGDYGTFYDSLAPYGSWFQTPDYGYVWQPVVVYESSWRPYTRGRWACSDRGWTWLSDEPHGWATYHYGRWCHLHDHGWVWVPGSEWAPCWVSWRIGDKHVGWAPLPPESLAYHGHHWDGTVDQTLGIGAKWYSFVETRHMGARISPHCLPYDRNDEFYQNTANVTNIHLRNHQVVCGGPGYREVNEGAGHSLPFYRLDLDHHTRPGADPLGMRPRIDGDRLRISAPNLEAAWNAALQPQRVKGRIETVTVDRSVTLRPDIADHFRQNREENRTTAEQSVSQLGGREQFNLHRLEQLDANRHLADETAHQTANNRDAPRKGAQNSRTTRPPEPADLTAESAPATRNPNLKLQQDANDRRDQTLKQQQMEAAKQRNQTGLAKLQQDANDQRDQALKQQQMEAAKQRDQAGLAKLQQDANDKRDQALKQQQMEAAKQRDQAGLAKLQQDANDRRDQALKQQQMEAAKQLEQARLAKLQQDAQAGQARQLQLQQQEENARREQARLAKLQQDAQAEQARQLQLQHEENARREQAVRQAEEARRQSERQAEESRKQSERQKADDEAKKGHGR